MKYLLSLLLILLMVSTVLPQTKTPVLGQTSLIYRDTFRKGVDVADTIGYISIKGASDFRLLWTSQDSTDVVIKYVLRNSRTGAKTALTSIDSMVTVKTNGSKGIGTAVALATLVGYDQVMFQLTQSADDHNGATAAKYIKIYIYLVAASGGYAGDEQNRKPFYNETRQFFYKDDYAAGDATDTSQFMSLNGVTDLRIFVAANDSLVTDVGYILSNSIIDSTTGNTKLGNTITFNAHTTTVADTCVSPGALGVATLIGWNKIRFTFNPTTDSRLNDGAETGKHERMYYYLLRRASQ
jgi:hypothetical protein